MFAGKYSWSEHKKNCSKYFLQQQFKIIDEKCSTKNTKMNLFKCVSGKNTEIYWKERFFQEKNKTNQFNSVSGKNAIQNHHLIQSLSL